MKYILRTVFAIISIPVFSRMWGRLMRVEKPGFLASRAVKFYKNLYKIDMKEYEGKVEDYPSISKFFLRHLDKSVRPLKQSEKSILSPADGKLVNVEYIDGDSATQVKGSYYSVNELLCENRNYSDGWYVATIYLSPADYHRYHYPVSAELTGYCHTKGPLFPVNESGLKYVKGLFVRNERIVCRFRKDSHDLYAVAVGATNVGSIKMEFIDNIVRDSSWKNMKTPVEQMGEMGRFEMGSTIVMVIPSALVASVEVENESRVQVGEPLFKIK